MCSALSLYSVSQHRPFMDLLQKEKLYFWLAFRHRSYEALSADILPNLLGGTSSAGKTESLSSPHLKDFVDFLFMGEEIILRGWEKELSDRTKSYLVMLILLEWSLILLEWWRHGWMPEAQWPEAQWSPRTHWIHSCVYRTFPYRPMPMQIFFPWKTQSVNTAAFQRCWKSFGTTVWLCCVNYCRLRVTFWAYLILGVDVSSSSHHGENNESLQWRGPRKLVAAGNYVVYEPAASPLLFLFMCTVSFCLGTLHSSLFLLGITYL